MLLRANEDVYVLDAEFLHWDQARIAKYITEENRPEIIGVSSQYFQYPGAKQTIETIRRVRPDAFIALGGPHITARPFDVYEECKPDLMVVGECEGNIVDLLVNKKKGRYFGEPLKNLDELPLPAWDHFSPDITHYEGNAPALAKPETVVMWDRGCPHACIFCNHPVFGQKKNRQRSPEHILAELEWLWHKWGIRGLFVYSDELIGMGTYQNEWLQTICQGMIDRGLNFEYKTQGRCAPKFIEQDTLDIMYKSGCRVIMWGCESGSQRVLDAMNKRTCPDDIIKTMEMSSKAGIRNFGFFMVGSLQETRQDVELTANLIRKLKGENLLDSVQVSIVTPAPGSKLWDICEENGWLTDSARTSTGRAMYETVWKNPSMSGDERKAYRDYLAKIGG
jgi:radical SAM superfamily enzyme YgiQ (UPF0313 family)